MERSAKIIATIGPACQDDETIRQLLQSGVNVARLNFSHGSHEDHAHSFYQLRHTANQLNQPITILQDLQGPKNRIGALPGGKRILTVGETVTLTSDLNSDDVSAIPVDFPTFAANACPGGRILLDDGNLELEITSIQDLKVIARVVLGGTLLSNKGVNLPGTRLDIPGFTEKDAEDLAFGLQLGVDVIAVSFVRDAQDIQLVRDAICRIAPNKANTPIIAKLERPEALDNLHEIIDISDGVMVARGDLGVELAPEMVPVAQKRIINAANLHGKVVITATQMLESMINNPRPTRAEASDVANAIFDGTDGVMLSGETAAGKFPLQAVKIMDAIIRQAEAHNNEWGHCKNERLDIHGSEDTLFTARAATELAFDSNVTAIAVFTRSGRSALLMSKVRPQVPILAFTPDVTSYHRMNLFWGVTPHLTTEVETLEDMITVVDVMMRKTSQLKSGEQVVLVCGFPIHEDRPINLILLHTVGQSSS
jgi:pyruvate kinase